MSSLKKPSPATIRRIYYALVRKPRSFEDLVNITGVTETALGSRALDIIVAKTSPVFNFAVFSFWPSEMHKYFGLIRP